MAEHAAQSGRPANRLIHESSPYLLQHAHNPVDWYPWCAEAQATARELDRPILLSIGYSACHWCHVMERESFEDLATAAEMNARFVNIKVDREERPDLDSIYMDAVQQLTGHGGWPMTVFLTPDGRPFYGGTYFPPQDRHGLPSFRRVMQAVTDAYQQRRGEVEQSAAALTAAIGERTLAAGSAEALQPTVLDAARQTLARGFDGRFGGFGSAPKFPQPMTLEFLLREHRRTGDTQALSMVELTLDRMAQGGLYDQLGGGFHRYSVDAVWLVPHFEKMLYDNAQLATIYLHAWQVTRRPLYRQVVEATLDYLVREMTAPAGGFYSTQDADSEGEEGKFFVWTPEEVDAVLGPEAGPWFRQVYDVTRQGNFEGHNILNVKRPPEQVAREAGVPFERLAASLAESRVRLLAVREQRVKPGRDDKVLTAWNGLALRAFAEAATVLDRADYLAVAVRNAEFVVGHLLVDGRLHRSWQAGRARFEAYLEDHACYADGLLALYEATFDRRWFDAAQLLARRLVENFADEAGVGFWDTARDHEPLVSRPKDLFDNATPAGNSVACDVLLRLAAYLGDPALAQRAAGYLAALAPAMERAPAGFGRLLCAAGFYLAGPREVAIIGDPAAPATRALLDAVRLPFLPDKVLALAAPGDTEAAAAIPLLADRPTLDRRATAYVCRHFTCDRPTTDPAVLAGQLGVAT